MKTKIDNNYFIIETEGSPSKYYKELGGSIIHNMDLFLDHPGAFLTLKFEDIPNLGQALQRNFPKSCFGKKIKIKIELPVMTDGDLQKEQSKKQEIDQLKTDIKTMQKRLKVLENGNTI